MAVVVNYNALGGASALVVVKKFYDYIVATTGFTVIDAASLTADGGWFVFKMDGYPWELWLGGRHAQAATPWHADNERSSDKWDVHYAFCPGGGWNAASDDPSISGAMFTDSKESEGGWGKIVLLSQSYLGANYDTIVHDVSTGFFCWLHGMGPFAWDIGLLVAEITTSSVGILDAAPWAALAGCPKLATVPTDWLRYTNSTGFGGTTLGSLLLPDPAITGAGTGTGKTTSLVIADSGPSYHANSGNQPNPVTGDIDWRQVEVRCTDTGSSHYRGGLSTDHVRIVSTSYATRQLNAAKTWCITDDGSAIPWDGTTEL